MSVRFTGVHFTKNKQESRGGLKTDTYGTNCFRVARGTPKQALLPIKLYVTTRSSPWTGFLALLATNKSAHLSGRGETTRLFQ